MSLSKNKNSPTKIFKAALNKAVTRLSYSKEYISILLRNGVDNIECLHTIIKDKHTENGQLRKIPIGHWINIERKINSIINKRDGINNYIFLYLSINK